MSLCPCHEILNIRGISRSHIIKHNKRHMAYDINSIVIHNHFTTTITFIKLNTNRIPTMPQE